MTQNRLHWRPIVILLILAMVWGANMPIVKVGTRDLAPLFMAGLRSLIAGFCLYIWMKAKGIKLFPSRVILFHGIVVGVMFGAEFSLLYVGVKYTLASRLYVLMYTAPFFVALGAHFFLAGDKLNPWKAAGLILAFIGIMSLFKNDLGFLSGSTFLGDIMALAAGALWGATTVYLKKYLAYRTVPLQTLFYQLFFSAPLLLLFSLTLEHPLIKSFSFMAGFSMFYQCIIIGFLSYLVWFSLIHRYPVSLLHAFSFFTPVFGVFLGGALILGEIISANVIVALILVSMGMVLVNQQRG